MICLSSLAGQPVVLDGQIVSRVEQAVLTRDGRRLRGLMVRRGIGAARWVPDDQIMMLGEVSVIIRARPVRLPEGADFGLTTVKDTGGLHLGRVTDVWLDPVSRETGALEISLGMLETMTGGHVTADHFAVSPSPDEPGQVLVPCGWLLRAPERMHAGRR